MSNLNQSPHDLSYLETFEKNIERRRTIREIEELRARLMSLEGQVVTQEMANLHMEVFRHWVNKRPNWFTGGGIGKITGADVQGNFQMVACRGHTPYIHEEHDKLVQGIRFAEDSNVPMVSFRLYWRGAGEHSRDCSVGGPPRDGEPCCTFEEITRATDALPDRMVLQVNLDGSVVDPLA